MAYNFINPESVSGLRPVTPFVLAGYGIGNAAPFFHSFIGRTSNAWDVSVLNLGAGVKAFVSESTALRAEYRFQRYMYDDTAGGVTSETTDEFQSVLVGFSLFFAPQRTRLPIDTDAGDRFWH